MDIDTKGNMAIPMHYDGLGSFVNQKALVRKDDEIFIMDKSGKQIGKPKTFELGYRLSFDKSLVIVKKDNKHGFINKTGKTIIPFFKYDNAYDFSEGLSFVKIFDKWLIIINKQFGFIVE